MKIAIATDNNKVSEHFGHCEGFTIIETKENKVISSEFIKNPGHKPGFLPVYLDEREIKTVISGGMGKGAIDLFNQKNIEVITGASGSIDNIIEKYLENELKSTNSVCEKHEQKGSCHS